MCAFLRLFSYLTTLYFPSSPPLPPKRWVYNMLGHLEMWQVFVGLVSTMTICLGTWQLGTSWEGSTVASPINSMIINIVAHVILSMQHRQKYMASCSL